VELIESNIGLSAGELLAIETMGAIPEWHELICTKMDHFSVHVTYQ
jgi:hypothetical protein